MITISPQELTDTVRDRYSVNPPLFLANTPHKIKIELKPYLQPFERELAVRELKALLDPGDEIDEDHGFFLVSTEKDENYLSRRLTYWQRIGRTVLYPTSQKVLEFTQAGLSNSKLEGDLHNARRLRYGPHDLHEYRGKFFPQLVRSLINVSTVREDALVLDPMCGSGTTLCESIACGRSAAGADMNPLSVLISNVKAGAVRKSPKYFSETLATHAAKFNFDNKNTADCWNSKDLEYLERWFAADALADIAGILADMGSIRDKFAKGFFRVCLSNILRPCSWQKETDLRVRKEEKDYSAGQAIDRFRSQVQRQIEKIHPYLCLLDRHDTSPTLTLRLGNAVQIDRVMPELVGKVDLIVTSPPYATALPYLDTDRLSLIVLGLLPRIDHRDAELQMVGTREVSEKQRRVWWNYFKSRRNELPKKICEMIDYVARANHQDGVGFRRRNLPALLGKYFLDMLDAMQAAHRMMKPDAPAYYVVGNNSTSVSGVKMDIQTDDLLFQLGESAGWVRDEMISMELIPSRDIFRENRGSKESILCFRAAK